MISSYLQGGEGNILFQIAIAYAYAKEVGQECAFDFIDGYFTQKPGMNYKDIFFKNIKTLNLTEFKKTAQIYQEPHFQYKEIPKFNQSVLFYGYFQTEKFFIKYREDLLKEFINADIIADLKNIYIDLLKNSLSIHVRRGDYLNLQDYHPCPSVEYYLNGIKKVEETKKIDHILVFSDDIRWCEEVLDDPRMVFIKDQKDYEDLYLMSLCENNIIANSSFSWWSSWFNKNDNKIIIAPKTWFGPALEKTHNWNDIYTDKMIIMNS
jgi:hypothetical protein